jgi:hypothetical protein
VANFEGKIATSKRWCSFKEERGSSVCFFFRLGWGSWNGTESACDPGPVILSADLPD